jgi:ribonuclease HII
MASVDEIDKYNILEATKMSMRRAVKKLNQFQTQLIIDGKIDLQLAKYPSKGIIKGDQKSYSIAAASIVAKIHRDRYMNFLSYKHPSYGWSSNAGYGTKKHIEEIYRKGITSHHRKSFEPIKSLIHSK